MHYLLIIRDSQAEQDCCCLFMPVDQCFYAAHAASKGVLHPFIHSFRACQAVIGTQRLGTHFMTHLNEIESRFDNCSTSSTNEICVKQSLLALTCRYLPWSTNLGRTCQNRTHPAATIISQIDQHSICPLRVFGLIRCCSRLVCSQCFGGPSCRNAGSEVPSASKSCAGLVCSGRACCE